MAQQSASKNKTSHPRLLRNWRGSKVYSDILDHFSYQNYKIITIRPVCNWTSILVLHFKFESSLCRPDPLRPVIHTTHPFCWSNFCLSSVPTEDSCQKIFVDFPSVDIREWFLSGQKQRHGIKRLNITKNVDGNKQSLLMVHFKIMNRRNKVDSSTVHHVLDFIWTEKIRNRGMKQWNFHYKKEFPFHELDQE